MKAGLAASGMPKITCNGKASMLRPLSLQACGRRLHPGTEAPEATATVKSICVEFQGSVRLAAAIMYLRKSGSLALLGA